MIEKHQSVASPRHPNRGPNIWYMDDAPTNRATWPGCHLFFIHTSINGESGYFYVLATENNPLKNKGLHISFQVSVFIFFRYIPRSILNSLPFLYFHQHHNYISQPLIMAKSVGLAFFLFVFKRQYNVVLISCSLEPDGLSSNPSSATTSCMTMRKLI